MNKFVPLLIFLVSVKADALSIEPMHEPTRPAICPGVVEVEAIEAPKPLVHVSPMYPSHAKEGSACVVVTFSLEEKPGTDGKALVPVKIKVDGATSNKFIKPSIKAVEKWLFLSNKANVGQRYYTEIKYELE